ncbi:retrotransposon protein, putative, ty1-copia subclass [Tanacetum coccineum]|uniref:Retrotransposon protein, putative, ty1-copia subclass n=1 Tax=Tanacetum coccineum TaxID=301880 RepID=A0ABQ5DJZ3_9ASTR
MSGALSLYMGNGQCVAVEAIGSYNLCFPNGLVVIFYNCHDAPSITRGVISVSCLYDDGFINRFDGNTISVSRNNVVYFSAVPRDGIYEIDLHISKKRIEKLQHDGLLNSTDIKSFEKCVSCMFGKMAQKPYSHHVEKAKDLLGLIHTDSFWDYALESVAHILNMVPTKKVEKTPYKVWHGQAPKMSYLKVWGCEALVKRDTLTKPNKLEPISIKCIFVGYPKETMGYSVYYPPKCKVFIARNAEFLKDDHITQEASGSLEDLEIIQEEDTHPSENTSIHHDEDRLVAKGITQIYGVDYEQTFSPVVDIRAIRILKAIVAFYDNEIWQMDVKTVVLNRHLSKEVYMVQPEAVGSIMYVVRCTCPDVAFVQNITSRFQQNPSELHWTAVKNILKYLCNTKDMFLVYGGDIKRELRVSCYTDKSTKQSIFITSSIEAEYIAALDTSKEADWVRKFISGLRVVLTIEEPIKMYCNNTRAITIANESGITKGVRHYRAKVHYLREVIEFGDVKIEKVHIDDNLVDPFTKALTFPKHSEHTNNIGMLLASCFM